MHSSFNSDTWINDRIHQISQQVDKYDQGGKDDDQRLHDLIVEAAKGIDEEATDAG